MAQKHRARVGGGTVVEPVPSMWASSSALERGRREGRKKRWKDRKKEEGKKRKGKGQRKGRRKER